MNAIEEQARELAMIVFSGRERGVILKEVGERMRCVMDAHFKGGHPEKVSPLGDEWRGIGGVAPAATPCSGSPVGLRSGVCPRSGKTCIGAVIGSPGHYNAGVLIGQAIREALAGDLSRAAFIRRLIEVFERPPQDISLAP